MLFVLSALFVQVGGGGGGGCTHRGGQVNSSCPKGAAKKVTTLSQTSSL